MPNQTNFATMDAKHSKCLNTPCTGPGCKATNHHYSTAEPRINTRPTKAERRLETRIAAFEAMKSADEGYHRPGSVKK